MLYRYSEWDGTQRFEPLGSDELMRHLADEVLQRGDFREALRRMLQRGAEFPNGQRMEGLRELLERMRSARERNLSRYNLGSIFDDIKERLDRVIDTERDAVRQRLQDADASAEGDEGLNQLMRDIAEKRSQQLDALPPDVGSRVKDLRDYDFLDPDARQQFEELLQVLQQQIMQNYFQGLQQGLQAMTPEMLSQLSQMVRDLNEMIEQRMSGQEPDFDGFMQKWGHFFPEGIENLDDLIEHMQKRIGQMQALLDSMTPETRRELEQMMEDLLRDNRLQWDLFRLATNLERLHPMRDWAQKFPFMGEDPVTLQEALKLMGDMNSLDSMERDLMQAVKSNDASQLDAGEIGRLRGEESRQMAEQLQEITRMLEEAGLIRRKGNDWELTPRAMRQIGERALQEVFAKVDNSVLGDHTRERGGIGVERLDDTKPYEFGDPFLMDTQRSVMNAVLRSGPGTPARLKPDDFEVYHTQAVTQCSTVIMLDMSYSMIMGGYFQAGRRVALALDTLIRSKFPKDNLDVVAFSYFALPLKPEMLLDSYWVEYGGGTNFQEGLRYARTLLSKHKIGTKQIVLLTDGQPTTYNNWSDSDAQWGRYRHSPAVVEETLREVSRCTKDGITINTFMMERDPSLVEFVRVMAKINRGRAFFVAPQRLGEYILLDYVNEKRKLMR